MNAPIVNYRFGDLYYVTEFVMTKNAMIIDAYNNLKNEDNDKFVENVAKWIRDEFKYPLDNAEQPAAQAQLLMFKKSIMNYLFKKCVEYHWTFPTEVIASGYGICVPPDTLILAKNGFKPICEVKEGELVLTHKGRFKKVTKLYKRYYEGKLIKISVFGGFKPLLCTPEHPILYFDGINEKWTKASEIKPRYKGGRVGFGFLSTPLLNEDTNLNWIKISDYLSIPYKIINENGIEYVFSGKKYATNCKKVKNIIPLTSSVLRLFGYYVAEGSMRSRGINISFGMHEKEKVEDVAKTVKECFGVEAKVEAKNDLTVLNVYFNSVILKDFFSNVFGKGARNKDVPDFILNLPAEKIKFFIEGWFKGDGSVRGKFLGTSSRKLAEKAWIIFNMKLGIPVSLRHYNNKNSTFGGREVYHLGLPDVNTAIAIAGLNSEVEVKYKKYKRKWFKTLDRLYKKIRRIEEVEFSGYVYNLEVEEDNSYVANGIIVHNCIDTANLTESVLRVKPLNESYVVLGEVRDTLTNQLLGYHGWCELPYKGGRYIIETTIHEEGVQNIIKADDIYGKKLKVYYVKHAQYNEEKYIPITSIGSYQIIYLLGLPARRVQLMGYESVIRMKPKKLYKEWREEVKQKREAILDAFKDI